MGCDQRRNDESHKALNSGRISFIRTCSQEVRSEGRWNSVVHGMSHVLRTGTLPPMRLITILSGLILPFTFQAQERSAIGFAATLLFNDSLRYNAFGYDGPAPLFVQAWFPLNDDRQHHRSPSGSCVRHPCGPLFSVCTMSSNCAWIALSSITTSLPR